MGKRNSGTVAKKKSSTRFQARRSTFLRRLGELIVEAGSENGFCQRVGIPRSTLDSWRNGEEAPKGPSADALLSISKEFKCTIDWLFWGDARAQRAPASTQVTEAAFWGAFRVRLESTLRTRLDVESLSVDAQRAFDRCVDTLERDFRTHAEAVRRHHGVHRPLWELFHFATGIEGGVLNLGQDNSAVHALIAPAAEAVMRGEPMRILRETQLPDPPAAWYAEPEAEEAALWPPHAVPLRPISFEAEHAVEQFAEELVRTLLEPPLAGEPPALQQLRALRQGARGAAAPG